MLLGKLNEQRAGNKVRLVAPFVYLQLSTLTPPFTLQSNEGYYFIFILFLFFLFFFNFFYF